MNMIGLITGVVLVIIAFVILAKTIRIVPQRQIFIIERLGKYSRNLEAGFHILVPFIEKVAYRHSLKEIAVDVPRQACITKDNITISVDGVVYMQVVNAYDASYGIQDYGYAAVQLAQTTLRSVIGKIDLDKTFEERDDINIRVVEALNQAATTWGVKLLRYEIADIGLPKSISEAMEMQMRAERERRAVVATSEGERQRQINESEGERAHMINVSEGEKTRQINEAEGRAREIEMIATATAEGLRKVAEAIESPGGKDAVGLRVAEQYVKEFGKLAKENNTMIVPAELANIGAAVGGLTSMLKGVNPGKAG